MPFYPSATDHVGDPVTVTPTGFTRPGSRDANGIAAQSWAHAHVGRTYSPPLGQDGTGTMCANLTVDDEGKRVVNTNGKAVGVVKDVEAGVAYVEPGPEMTDSIKSRLRRDRDVADGMENFQLDEDYVDEITGDEIRLQRF
ncbi:hypothetical protein [Natrinema salifodinae]